MIGRFTSSPAPYPLSSVTLAPPAVGSSISNAVVSSALPQQVAGVASQPIRLQSQAPPLTSPGLRTYSSFCPPASITVPTPAPLPVAPLSVAPSPVTRLPVASLVVTPPVESKLQEVDRATSSVATSATSSLASSSCATSSRATPAPPPPVEAERLARTLKYNRDLLKAAGFADNVLLPPANEDPRGDYLENMKFVEAREVWLAPDACKQRRRRVGLDSESIAEFCKNSEFISLGCQCVPARTMQALNLRNASYPFDWARTPVRGVMHLFQTRFQDLFETTGERHVDESTGSYVIRMKWGGSCVHHDPEVPKTRADFARRAERLLGSGSVLPSQTRVFVRAANSSNELCESLALFTVLKRALPEARCYLIVLIDLQLVKGPVQPAFADVIHYCISKDVYDNGSYSMEKHCEAYAEAIAFAIKAFAGDADAWRVIREAPQMAAVCQRFTGGDPSKEFFNPVRY